MSKIINESSVSSVYPGWEIPEKINIMQEKALLIKTNVRQDLIFRCLNAGTVFGIMFGFYMLVSADIEKFILSHILIHLFLYTVSGSATGAVAGVVIAKIKKV